MQVALRRYRDTLRISGLAVIAFGVWTIIKGVVSLILLHIDLAGMLGEDAEGLLAVVMLPLYLFLVGLLVAELLMRIYIGRSACAAAAGTKKGNGYLVVCMIVIILNVISVGSDIRTLVELIASGINEDLIDRIISLVFSFTSFYILLELFVTAIRIKRMEA